MRINRLKLPLAAILLTAAAPYRPTADSILLTGLSTNVALQAVPTANLVAGTSTTRRGFYAAGDGGAATYVWGPSGCSLNGGAGDNGSQVAPTGGTGCWIANFAGTQPTPMIWGAVGNGVTNDSAAVQAAATAMAGQTLYSGPYSYLLATGITLPSGTQLVCPSNVARSAPSVAPFDFIAGSINLNLITLGQSNYFGHCSINMGAPGTSTSGAALTVPNVADVVIDNLYIKGGCLQVDLSGNVITFDHAFLASGTCGGVRVGHASTGSLTTDARISNVIVQGVPGTTPYGMRVEDAGGLLLYNNDMLNVLVGTWVIPGLNQWVAWLSASNTYMGDTGGGRGIVFDTADATARITGAQISNGWSSNNTTYNVDIENTAGGLVQGIHFVGLRSYIAAGAASIFINAGTDVTIDDSHICGTSAAGTGIYVNTGASNGAIRNTTISGSCDSFGNTSAVDLTFVGGNASWIVTGNTLAGATTYLNGAPTGASVVRDNIPLDTTPQGAVAAATIQPGPWSILNVSGTTAVTTIGSPWNGRQLTIVPSGALPLATGGNICNALTATAGVPLLLTYTGTCWVVK